MLKKVGETLEYVEKVFDAEGVSLEIGDTVYCYGYNEAFTVVRSSVNVINAEDRTIVEDNEGTHYAVAPSRLSHKCPILDADGELINVGDTVWTIYDGSKHVISAVFIYGSKKYHIRTVDPVVEYEDGGWDFAKKVTHKCPDNRERNALLELADEIAEAGDGEYVNCDTRRIYRLMPAKANEWAERIRKAAGECSPCPRRPS